MQLTSILATSFSFITEDLQFERLKYYYWHFVLMENWSGRPSYYSYGEVNRIHYHERKQRGDISELGLKNDFNILLFK